MGVVFLTTAYLAPIEYYAHMLAADKVRVEQHDHYMKQTYRNRCIIAGPAGRIDLTVPTVKPDSLKCPTKDIRISDHGNWRHLHFYALESAYGHTPYFEYYRDDFVPFYEKGYEFLIDFNEALQEMICGLIDMQPCVERTSEYIKEVGNGSLDLREVIHPKHDYAMMDGAFKVVPYYQVFQEKLGFIPNLSIVDLLFNLGPESLLLLKQSINDVEDRNAE
ncbi:MAG: WbqC family protein [Bacteroidaceae bacterium]|nr:WbqC family protein [Bacteroidaceae bacterium]